MKKSDAFAIAIAAVVDTKHNEELNVTEFADLMGTLCDARSIALHCEQRDEEEAAKAKAEQEAADHVES